MSSSQYQQYVTAAAGSPNQPSIGFVNDPQSGFFLKSTGVIGLSIAGAEVTSWNSSGQSETDGIFSAGDGSNTAPSYTFTSDSDTGLYRIGANSLGATAGGTLTLTVDGSGVTCNSGKFLAPSGDATAPTHTFSTDADTGLYSASANTIGFAANGAIAASLTTTGLTLPQTSNQLVLGVTNTTTISATAPAASRVYTIPDVLGAASFVMTAGAQTVAGAKTLSSALTITPVTNQLVLGVTNTTTLSATAPAASRTYTIPDVLGAADFVMTAGAQTLAGAKTFSAAIIPSAGITGTTTNDSAAAGIVGELLTQSRLRSAAASLTTTATLNVTATALSLTAGDWDVEAIIGVTPGAGTSLTTLDVGISLASATFPATDTIGVPTAGESRAKFSSAANVLGTDLTLQTVKTRISLSGTASVYLVANATFSVSTLTVYGSISARRVR